MNITTLTPYDPAATRDFSPLKIGKHTVTRTPLHGTPHILYCLMDGPRVIGRQISRPSVSDCDWMVRFHSNQERAATKKAAPQAWDSGPLTDRIITLLKAEKLGLAKISTTLNSDPDVISPILTRLTAQNRILRRGGRGKYVYEAFPV